jgi:hypothetical protein
VGGLIGPKTSVNYVLALFLGVLFPYFSSSSFFYINNSIQNTGDISKLTQIPLIGVVGLNKEISELAVLTDLSRLCQSLRAIRSSLQYLYKQKNGWGKDYGYILSKWRRKTFCCINIATVLH